MSLTIALLSQSHSATGILCHCVVVNDVQNAWINRIAESF